MKKLSIIKQMLKATLLTILVVFNSYDLYSQTQLEDSYSLNNTYSFKVEQEEDIKTATNNQFILILSPYMYAYLYTEDEIGVEGAGQELYVQDGNDTLITINNGHCYAISVIGVQSGNSGLIQYNNNDTIFYRPIGGALFESKLYYFNVDSTLATVDEYYNNAEILYVEYFDLMGRLQHTSNYGNLVQGIYLKVSYYSDGKFKSEKVAKVIH